MRQAGIIAAAGIYAVAVKLATVVIVAVRGFQYAWPPLAYSITDEDEARHLYALVTTAYVIVAGLVVGGLTLLGRWVVRALTSDPFFAAHEPLPWVALGWALYGLFLVFVTIAGIYAVSRVPLCDRMATRAALLLRSIEG